MATRRRRGSGRAKRDFWGNDDLVAETPPQIRPTVHPTALVESLGPLPFPGGAVAPHYFDLVYERAINMATALAASAGLLEMEELDDALPAPSDS
jgi:hypothetical protein